MIVSYRYATYTYSIWTGLNSEPRKAIIIDSAAEVFRTKVSYDMNTDAHSEIITGNTSKDRVKTDVAIKEIVDITKQIAINNDIASEEVKTSIAEDEIIKTAIASDDEVETALAEAEEIETTIADTNEVETAIAGVESVEKKYERLFGCRLLPDILTIGFEKCGTITLNTFLGIHPQVFIAREENYRQFNDDSTVSVQEYNRNKQCTPPGQFRLNKLGTQGTAENAFKVIPNAKLLAIVREPVERAMSHYLMLVEKGKESNQSNFDSTIASNMDNEEFSSVLFNQSRFIDKLKPWIAKYGLDNIHIVDGDTFVKNPGEDLQKVERFLGLQPFITENHFVYSTDKGFYCLKGQNDDVKCGSSKKGRPHPQMSNETRTRLHRYFKPFNNELFRTIGRNFSWNY